MGALSIPGFQRRHKPTGALDIQTGKPLIGGCEWCAISPDEARHAGSKALPFCQSIEASSLDDVPSARDDVDIGDILPAAFLAVPLALVFLTAKILYVEPMAEPLNSDGKSHWPGLTAFAT